MLMILSISGGVLSADRRVDAIEVRCASFTQILALKTTTELEDEDEFEDDYD